MKNCTDSICDELLFGFQLCHAPLSSPYLIKYHNYRNICALYTEVRIWHVNSVSSAAEEFDKPKMSSKTKYLR